MTPLGILVGLFFLSMGVAAFYRPKLRGPRDVKLISGDVGSGERVGAYAIGVFLTLLGLGFLYLGLRY